MKKKDAESFRQHRHGHSDLRCGMSLQDQCHFSCRIQSMDSEFFNLIFQYIYIYIYFNTFQWFNDYIIHFFKSISHFFNLIALMLWTLVPPPSRAEIKLSVSDCKASNWCLSFRRKKTSGWIFVCWVGWHLCFEVITLFYWKKSI